MPAISILMPVYQAAATLDEAMESLLRQTFDNFEVVAVDDGSTDGSNTCLDSWRMRDPRVHVVQRPRQGLVAALNAGLQVCRAPVIARMDADDLCHPERLEATHTMLVQRPDVAVAGCLVEGVSCAGGVCGGGMARYIAWSNGLVQPEDIARQRFVESPVVHPTVLVRRQVFDHVGAYRHGPFPEDYDLWLRVLGAGFRIAKVPRVLLTWRDHDRRATRTDERYEANALRRTKVEHLLEGPLARRPRVVFWGAGIEGKPFMPALQKHGITISAVVEVNPRKIGQTIHGACVISEGELDEALANAPPPVVVLVAVGVPSARPEIRSSLVARGLIEGETFFFLR